MAAPKHAATPAETIVVLHDPAAEAAIAEVPVIDETATDEVKLPRTATLQPDGSVDLVLGRPVEITFRPSSGAEARVERYDTLHMHRLTGADMIALGNTSDGSRAWAAIARSARIFAGKMNLILERMDGADVNAAGQVVGFFLEPGRPTGR